MKLYAIVGTEFRFGYKMREVSRIFLGNNGKKFKPPFTAEMFDQLMDEYKSTGQLSICDGTMDALKMVLYTNGAETVYFIVDETGKILFNRYRKSGGVLFEYTEGFEPGDYELNREGFIKGIIYWGEQVNDSIYRKSVMGDNECVFWIGENCKLIGAF